MGNDDLVAVLNEVYDGAGGGFDGGGLFRQSGAQSIAAKGDDDAFTHSYVNLSEKRSRTLTGRERVRHLIRNQNFFLCSSEPSISIRALTGSLTRARKIMAAMM